MSSNPTVVKYIQEFEIVCFVIIFILCRTGNSKSQVIWTGTRSPAYETGTGPFLFLGLSKIPGIFPQMRPKMGMLLQWYKTGNFKSPVPLRRGLSPGNETVTGVPQSPALYFWLRACQRFLYRCTLWLIMSFMTTILNVYLHIPLPPKVFSIFMQFLIYSC